MQTHKMKYKPIDIEKLRRDFCLVDGVLFRIKKTIRPAKLGTDKSGYKRVFWQDGLYQAHRLIWVLHHGVDLENQIDHIDGDTSNNSIENLREVTPRVNCGNKRIHRDGKLPGFKKHKGRGYSVSLRISGVCVTVGVYFTEEEAHEAYKKAYELGNFFDGDHAKFRDLVKNNLSFSSTNKEVVGCRYREATGVFEAYISIGNKSIRLGQYSSEEESKAIRSKARELEYSFQNPKQFRKLLQDTIGISEKLIKYKGVTREKRNNKWGVRISENGVKCSLGFYDDLSLAELVYETADLMRDKLKDPKEFKALVLLKLGIKQETPRGYIKLPSGKYHVVMGLDKSRIVLGTFETEEKAKEIYQKAVENRDKFTNKEEFKKLVLSA